jgi:cold shock CspA family protein
VHQTSLRSDVIGFVTSFDEASGDGVITATEGEAWPFHCTQISNGARYVRIGTLVAFDVIAGLPGRWEASRLRSSSRDTFLCPVCAAVVEGDEGTYEICPACGWEDDPVQRDDTAHGGANSKSLDEARRCIR